MPASYTGDDSHISDFDTTEISVTEPVDGDAEGAASVTSALEKLADYVEYIRKIFAGALSALALDVTNSITVHADDSTDSTFLGGLFAAVFQATTATVTGTLTNKAVPVAVAVVQADGTLLHGFGLTTSQTGTGSYEITLSAAAANQVIQVTGGVGPITKIACEAVQTSSTVIDVYVYDMAGTLVDQLFYITVWKV